MIDVCYLRKLYHSNQNYNEMFEYHSLYNALLSDIWAFCYHKRLHEQDKSSNIEQQPPFGDHKYSYTLPQKRGGGVQN